MTTLMRLSILAALTVTMAACASAPPPPPEDYAAPARRQLDAKTQLESGRRY